MYGDGTFYFDKKRNKLVYGYYDGNGKPCKKRFPNSPAGKKARLEYAKETRSKRDHEELVSTSYTVGSWVISYLTTYKKPKLRKSSFERECQSAAKITAIADIPFDELKPVAIQKLYISLSKSLSSSSVAKVHRLLFGAYKQAVKLEIISKNPMVKVDPVKVTVKKKEIFTFRELLHMFRALRKIRNDRECLSVEHDYETMFLFLLTTGVRIGELLSLRWEDINLSTKEVSISRTVAKKNEINNPKTPRGNRIIPLLYAPLVKRLYKAKYRGKITRVTGYVYATSSGKPIGYSQVLKFWNHVCDLSGVHKSLHTFRHTFATIALAKGIPLLEVSRILGHAQTSTTVNMYGHSIQNYNHKLLEQFGRSLKIV